MKIPSSALPVVAAEVRAAVVATDQALLAHANMRAAVLDGAAASDASIHLTQDLYARMMAHGAKLVEGRKELLQLIARLTATKNMSDQREVALGCPAGAPEKPITFFAVAERQDAHLNSAGL